MTDTHLPTPVDHQNRSPLHSNGHRTKVAEMPLEAEQLGGCFHSLPHRSFGVLGGFFYLFVCFLITIHNCRQVDNLMKMVLLQKSIHHLLCTIFITLILTFNTQQICSPSVDLCLTVKLRLLLFFWYLLRFSRDQELVPYLALNFHASHLHTLLPAGKMNQEERVEKKTLS